MKLEDDILIEKFLRNELSKEDQNAFLERLESDADFKQHYLLEKQLSEALNEESWSFADQIDNKEFNEYEALFKSDEIQDLKAVIKKASHKTNNVGRGRIISFISGFAASVLIGFFLLKPMFEPNVLDTNGLYTEYASLESLPSFVERGTNNFGAILNEGEKLFREKKFRESLAVFNRFLDANKEVSGAYIYAALAETELKNYDNAIGILNELATSNLIDAEKAYWYKALISLKKNKIDDSKELLEKIIKNNFYKSKEAKELLDKL
ncbi:hypothetical protein BTO06_03405 [Tenacibaculum sp. SZ-18]|uniref:tetratricopeptide repeat protein n=1 Tax=Tenacibaculum sp. SZ-18 TaxID=754423 RepID=UPI000C2D4125|nr:hypothetical protein [Tenacibaculum sp. SZ-18]AUC14252.1 hypothetical protein BTO06_03405 [Tenacibaculum sp. SZ-18]